MQETNNTKIVEKIIWKYCNGKRMLNSEYRNSLNELALFLYKQKREIDNFTWMVQWALGEQCNYTEGIISQEEEAILIEHYQEAVELLVNPGLDGVLFHAEHLQPKEITDYASSFFKPKKKYRVVGLFEDTPTCVSRFYNPFTGLASYELALPEYAFYGEEINSETWALSQIRMHAHGISADISRDDFFSTKEEEESLYDGIITTPPFGMPGERSIERVVTKLYDMLMENGKMVVVVNSGFLLGSSRSSVEIRKRLLEDKVVTDIILLPEGLYTGTGVQTAILVIEKCSHSSVNIVDASSAFTSNGKSRVFDVALLEELIKNQQPSSQIARQFAHDELLTDDCNLYPARLLAQQAIDMGHRLSDIAEVVSLTKVPDEMPNALYLSPSELRPDFARVPVEVSKLERRVIKPGRYYLIESPVVVFDYNLHSDKVRVAYLEDTPVEPIYASAFTVVLKPNETISPLYLMLVLSDVRVRRQLAGISSGAVFRRISLGQVANIVIPTHSLEEQEQMVQDAMKASMSQTEKELDAAFAKYQKAVRSRKHALSQNVSALSALWNAFDLYRKTHETISNKDMVGRKHARSVEEICNTISVYLKTICAQTEAIASVSYNWGDVEWIGLPVYIWNYIRDHRSTEYDFIDASDHSEFEQFRVQMEGLGADEAVKRMLEDETEPPYENIKFPRKALDRIINNIVANAVAHGFVDKARDDYRICFNWKDEDGNVVLYISNNGAPLHPELDSDAVLEYGRSTSLNEHGHSGLGGYEIADIMEQFGGSVEVLSTPNEEYTVTYKLTFTRVSRYLPEDEVDY